MEKIDKFNDLCSARAYFNHVIIKLKDSRMQFLKKSHACPLKVMFSETLGGLKY